jgi:hypothetical protein
VTLSWSWRSSLSSADPSFNFPPPHLPLGTATFAVQVHNTFREGTPCHEVTNIGMILSSKIYSLEA